MPGVLDLMVDEAGAGKFVFALILIVAGVAAALMVPQLGVIAFLRGIGQRLAAGALW